MYQRNTVFDIFAALLTSIILFFYVLTSVFSAESLKPPLDIIFLDGILTVLFVSSS